MGKHDRHFEPGSAEYFQAEAERQRKRAEFAEETCRQLREQMGRTNKWLSEVEANAEDKISELEAENAKLRGKIVKLVESYV